VKRALNFLKRALRCLFSQQAKTGLAGSSCARACGARKDFFCVLYGTTSQAVARKARSVLNAQVVP